MMKVLTRDRSVRCGISLLVVIAVLFSFGYAWASSEGGHGGESSFDKGKDLLWRTLNFAVLIGALIFLLRKPLAKGLEARRQGIRDQLDDLEKQKLEAQKELAAYQEKLSRLDQEVDKIVAEYVQQGEALKAKIIEEAKSSADKLQEQAKKNIEHEFEKARKELRAEMAAQAVEMAEDLIKKNIKDEDQQRIIQEYLTKVVVAQ